MNTETYERLLAHFERLAKEQQTAHDAVESDWLKGFYAGQVGAYKSATTIARIINGEHRDYLGLENEVPEESTNPLLDYLIAGLPFNQPTTTQE